MEGIRGKTREDTTCVYVWEVKAQCVDGGACNAYVYGMLSSLTLLGHTRAFSCVYMHAMQLILLMVRVCASYVIYFSLDSLFDSQSSGSAPLFARRLNGSVITLLSSHFD